MTLAGESMLEIEADAKHLAARIAVAASVVPTKTVRPILTGMVLDARGPHLFVTGGDDTAFVQVRVDQVNVLAAGRVLVNGARLSSLMREVASTGDKVTFTEDTGGVVVRVPGARVKLLRENAADYPEMAPWPADDAPSIPVMAADLMLAIDRTAMCVSDLQGKFSTHGLHLRVDKGDSKMEVVGCDGRRIAVARIKLADPAPFDLVYSLPLAAALAIAKLGRDDTAAEWRLYQPTDGADRLFIGAGAARVWARPIVGNYPPYRDLLAAWPSSATQMHVNLERPTFLSAVRRASLVWCKETSALECEFRRGVLVVKSRSPETGEAQGEVPIDWPGDPHVAGWASAYLMEVAKLMPEKFAIELHMDQYKKKVPGPIIIRQSFGERVDWLYAVMPLKLGE